MITFSLLLCTMNRKKEVRECLQSLFIQDFTEYEIIVVDQSDIIDLDLEHDNRLKYVYIEPKGLSNARNVGLQLAKGRYIALIDDDAIYDTHYLKEAYSLLNTDKKIGIVSGRGRDKITGEYLIKGMRNSALQEVKIKSIFSFIISPVAVFRRDVLNDGFDEEFGIGGIYNAAEESDIAFDCIEAGHKILYNPNMIVAHPSGNNESVDLKKVFKYSIGIGAVLKKHYIKTRKPIYWRMYIISLLRSIGGCVLFFLGKKKYIRSKYALKGKIIGFHSYKKEDLG